jgi:hypothetical protein
MFTNLLFRPHRAIAYRRGCCVPSRRAVIWVYRIKPIAQITEPLERIIIKPEYRNCALEGYACKAGAVVKSGVLNAGKTGKKAPAAGLYRFDFVPHEVPEAGLIERYGLLRKQGSPL